MACSLQTLAGLAGSCEGSKGGIVRAYIANFNDISAWTFVNTTGTTPVRESVSAITMNSGKTFYEYNFKKNVGSMTSTLNVDDAAGVNFVQTDVVLQFSRMDTTKRLEMSALSLNDLVAVVVDANSKYWCLGIDEPVSASAGNGQTGQNRTDGNYYQITLQGNDDTYPMELLPNATPEAKKAYMEGLC